MSKTTARKPVKKHPASKSAPAAKGKTALHRKAAVSAKAKPAELEIATYAEPAAVPR